MNYHHQSFHNKSSYLCSNHCKQFIPNCLGSYDAGRFALLQMHPRFFEMTKQLRYHFKNRINMNYCMYILYVHSENVKRKDQIQKILYWMHLQWTKACSKVFHTFSCSVSIPIYLFRLSRNSSDTGQKR